MRVPLTVACSSTALRSIFLVCAGGFRLKHEEEAWAETTQFYNAYHATGLAELEKRAQSRRAKGKQRATHDWEEWAPAEADLPAGFRGSAGLDLARSILSEDAKAPSPVLLDAARLPYKARPHTLRLPAHLLTRPPLRARSTNCAPSSTRRRA